MPRSAFKIFGIFRADFLQQAGFQGIGPVHGMVHQRITIGIGLVRAGDLPKVIVLQKVCRNGSRPKLGVRQGA